MNVSLNKLLVVGWFSLMTVISAFLIAEYQFFKTQAHQLERLKDDYLQHIDRLKKHIQGTQEHSDENGKKKESERQPVTQRLLLVNRAFTYLKRSALTFARGYHLEGALKKMYETASATVYAKPSIVKRSLAKHAFTQSRRKNRKRTRSTKRTHKKTNVALMRNQWRKLPHEPVLHWPLERSSFWLSSPYGPRKNPGGWGFHTGIDLAALRGTPIMAAGSGVVTVATYTVGYGNTIIIEHDHKFKTRYAHLDRILVQVGQQVKQGECIGKVGSTGFVRKRKGGDGSHLHFEVYVFGKHANPFHFLV